MRFSFEELATITQGRLVGAELVATTAAVSGVSIDSREVTAGQLFVPIAAARDGHDFIAAAVQRGAAAYLTARGAQGGVAIEVPDTQQALTALGASARARLPQRVIGVTGSVGKTSTKDLLSAVLGARYRTAASPRSFNNELGLPLTLTNAPDDTEAVIVEMGARGIGHIAALCAVARPTVGVITRVEHVHTEMFGSIEAVAQAKGELVEALPTTGAAVLNADDPAVAAMATRTQATVITYGERGDIRASDVTVDAQLRARFTLHTPDGSVAVRLGVAGAHQVGNALAAVAVGRQSQVPLPDIAAALETAQISAMRMELGRGVSGAHIINDAYNANPTSVRAAITALLELPVRRRVAVLGVMAELGPQSAQMHRDITAFATAHDVAVVAVDAPDYGPEATHVSGVDDAVVAVGPLDADVAVLVKGSRVAALEKVAARL